MGLLLKLHKEPMDSPIKAELANYASHAIKGHISKDHLFPREISTLLTWTNARWGSVGRGVASSQYKVEGLRFRV